MIFNRTAVGKDAEFVVLKAVGKVVADVIVDFRHDRLIVIDFVGAVGQGQLKGGFAVVLLHRFHHGFPHPWVAGKGVATQKMIEVAFQCLATYGTTGRQQHG